MTIRRYIQSELTAQEDPTVEIVIVGKNLFFGFKTWKSMCSYPQFTKCEAPGNAQVHLSME